MSSSTSSALGATAAPTTRSDRVPNILMCAGIVAGSVLVVGGMTMRLMRYPPGWMSKLRIGRLSLDQSGYFYTSAGVAAVAFSILLRNSAVQGPDGVPGGVRGAAAGLGGLAPAGSPTRAVSGFHQQARRAKDLHAYLRAQIGASASKLVSDGVISPEDLENRDPEALSAVCRYAAYLTVKSSKRSSVACGDRLQPIQGLDLGEPIELFQPDSTTSVTRYVQLDEDGEERPLRVFVEDDAFTAWNQPVDTVAARRALDALDDHDALVEALIAGDDDCLEELEEEAREKVLAQSKEAGKEITEEQRKNVAEHVGLTPLVAMGAQIEKRYLPGFELHYSSEDGVFIKEAGRHAGGYQSCANMQQLFSKGMKDARGFIKSQVELTEEDEEWTPLWYVNSLRDMATCNALAHLEIDDDDGKCFSVKLGSRVLAECDPLENVRERRGDQEPGLYYPANAALPREGTSEPRALVDAIEQIQALSDEEKDQLRLALMKEALVEKGKAVPEFSEEIEDAKRVVQTVRVWWDGEASFPRYLWTALYRLQAREGFEARLPDGAASPWLHSESQGSWQPMTEAYLERLDLVDQIEPAPMHYRREDWLEAPASPVRKASPGRDQTRLTRVTNREQVLAILQSRGQLFDTSSLHECIYEALANAVFKDPSTTSKPARVNQLRGLVADYILNHRDEWMELVGAVYPPGQSAVAYEADDGRARLRFLGQAMRYATNIDGLNVRLPRGMELTESHKRRAVEKYANSIRLGNIWGGSETLQALSAIFDRPVWVYDLRGGMVEVPVTASDTGFKILPSYRFGDEAGGQPIELVRKNDNHYMCLRAW